MAYIILGFCIILVLINTTLVIFASMLSSKISRREIAEGLVDCPERETFIDPDGLPVSDC